MACRGHSGQEPGATRKNFGDIEGMRHMVIRRGMAATQRGHFVIGSLTFSPSLGRISFCKWALAL
jgi:hypothetical protein